MDIILDNLHIMTPQVLLLGAACLLVLTALVVRSVRRGQRDVLLDRMGLSGVITYADQGKKGSYFISKRYGIVAKPDFIVQLSTGENAIVEFKSRANGRLYGSDIAQVKASALAVREKMPIQRAYVMAGTRRHEIYLAKNDETLFSEIQKEVEYTRRAAQGELIMEFTKNPQQCAHCTQKEPSLKKISALGY
jgi:CRISPR/Cas system-associated exonuclease Cas4 (RecB family)